MPRLYKYITVNKLPINAIKVSDYAKQINCSHSLLYHRITRKKADFRIVVFQGINFIIPN